MTPITKNVQVTDDTGNQYEATYPKRAKGLVKNGRARFVDKNKICLACPPNKLLEDKNMENNSDIEFAREQITKMISLLEKPNIAGDTNLFCNPQLFSEAAAMINGYLENAQRESEIPEEPTMKYVLSKIDQIINDNKHIYEALGVLRDMPNAEGPGDIVGQAKAQSVGETVKYREATNQQALRLLEKMYDGLKPQSTSNLKDKALKLAERTMNNATLTTEEKSPLLDVLDTVRHIGD